jgi:hypothetical protein
LEKPLKIEPLTPIEKGMTKVSWQEHFKNSLQGAQEAFAAARAMSALEKDSSEPSFLAYCLLENLIPSREYLEWAKETHQLPVLTDEFFIAHAASSKFFQTYKSLHPWNSACLPVAEWDGVLLVACLEVPLDFPADRPAAFLLAAPALMAQTWHFYSQPAPQYGEIDPLENLLADPALAGVSGSAAPSKDLFDANGDLILKEEELTNAGSNPSIDLEVVEEQAGGSPEGLFAETVVDATMFTSVAPGLEANTLTAAAPEGLVKGPRTVEALVPVENSDLHRSPPVAASAVNLEEDVIDMNIAPAQKPLAGMPLKIPPKAAPQTPMAPVKTSTQSGIGSSFPLEKMRSKNPEAFEANVKASFKKIKPYFKKSMLLAVGGNDQVIKPLIWDDNFKTQEARKSEFELQTPSFFRIVSTTQKPYHGFVVTNDFNDSFFEAWNQGQIPDHITLVPVMDGDHVIGMLLGIGEKASYNRQVLQFTETTSKDLSLQLAKAQIGSATNKAVA